MSQWKSLCLFALCVLYSHDANAKVIKAEIQLFPSACQVSGCTVSGRVVRKSRWLGKDESKTGKFRLFMKAMRRLTRKGVTLTTVRVQLGHRVQVAATDSRGYFSTTFQGPLPELSMDSARPAATSRPVPPTARAASSPTTRTTLPARPASRSANPAVDTTKPPVRPGATAQRVVVTDWQTSSHTGQTPGIVSYGASSNEPSSKRLVVAPGKSLVVYPTSEEGVSVISDVDDTLIHTYVTSKRKLLKTFLFRSYSQIKVVSGALGFVSALLKGPNGRGGGALHYVTGSPYRIFDRVQGLFRLRKFPVGSLHMKRLKGPKAHGLSKQLAYKLSHILPLFRMYPKRRFVLIGDSGEKDPAVYLHVRSLYPKRVAGIYIHHVSKDSPKALRFVGVTLFRDYQVALQHARQHGLAR